MVCPTNPSLRRIIEGGGIDRVPRRPPWRGFACPMLGGQRNGPQRWGTLNSPDHQQDARLSAPPLPCPSARSIALHHEASRDPHRDASNFGVVTST
jgi:hypothetical protein